MQSYSFTLGALALALGVLVAAPSGQGHEHLMIKPADLKWADVPSLPPGAKIAVIEGKMSEAQAFTVRLSFPANYKLPAHWHPAVERVTVLSGTFHMGTGDKLDSSQDDAADGRIHRHHAAQDQSLCLDQRGDGGPAARHRSVGDYLCERG